MTGFPADRTSTVLPNLLICAVVDTDAVRARHFSGSIVLGTAINPLKQMLRQSQKTQGKAMQYF